MNDITNKEDAEKEANRLIGEAHKNLAAATNLADIWGIGDLTFDPAYGMGGSYNPVHTKDSKWDKTDEGVLSNLGYWDGEYNDDESGWRASSSSC